MIRNQTIWKGALVFTGILIAYNLFLDFVLRTQGGVSNNYQSLVCALGIFYTLFEYRKEQGSLRTVEGFKVGYLAVLLGGFVYSVYTSAYLNFIRPEEKIKIMDFQMEMLKKQSFSEQELEQIASLGKVFFEPIPLVFVSWLALLISCSFPILMLSFIMRTPKDKNQAS
ncbi:MAG: DUF4199 domain-containing protein [Cytophagales bacterium]